MARALPPLLMLLCLLAWASPASAQGIRRCVDARGMSIFTDRPCSEMNAVPMQAPPATEGNLAEGFRGGFSQRGCARRPEDLLERVRGALEARDVNRLASHYHWTGTGTGSGTRLMDALERIAGQPLISAELVYPEAPPDYPGAAAGDPSQTGSPERTWNAPTANDSAPAVATSPHPKTRRPNPPPASPPPPRPASCASCRCAPTRPNRPPARSSSCAATPAAGGSNCETRPGLNG